MQVPSNKRNAETDMVRNVPHCSHLRGEREVAVGLERKDAKVVLSVHYPSRQRSAGHTTSERWWWERAHPHRMQTEERRRSRQWRALIVREERERVPSLRLDALGHRSPLRVCEYTRSRLCAHEIFDLGAAALRHHSEKRTGTFSGHVDLMGSSRIGQRGRVCAAATGRQKEDKRY